MAMSSSRRLVCVSVCLCLCALAESYEYSPIGLTEQESKLLGDDRESESSVLYKNDHKLLPLKHIFNTATSGDVNLFNKSKLRNNGYTNTSLEATINKMIEHRNSLPKSNEKSTNSVLNDVLKFNKMSTKNDIKIAGIKNDQRSKKNQSKANNKKKEGKAKNIKQQAKADKTHGQKKDGNKKNDTTNKEKSITNNDGRFTDTLNMLRGKDSESQAKKEQKNVSRNAAKSKRINNKNDKSKPKRADKNKNIAENPPAPMEPLDTDANSNAPGAVSIAATKPNSTDTVRYMPVGQYTQSADRKGTGQTQEINGNEYIAYDTVPLDSSIWLEDSHISPFITTLNDTQSVPNHSRHPSNTLGHNIRGGTLSQHGKLFSSGNRHLYPMPGHLPTPHRFSDYAPEALVGTTLIQPHKKTAAGHDDQTLMQGKEKDNQNREANNRMLRQRGKVLLSTDDNDANFDIPKKQNQFTLYLPVDEHGIATDLPSGADTLTYAFEPASHTNATSDYAYQEVAGDENNHEGHDAQRNNTRQKSDKIMQTLLSARKEKKKNNRDNEKGRIDSQDDEMEIHDFSDLSFDEVQLAGEKGGLGPKNISSIFSNTSAETLETIGSDDKLNNVSVDDEGNWSNNRKDFFLGHELRNALFGDGDNDSKISIMGRGSSPIARQANKHDRKQKKQASADNKDTEDTKQTKNSRSNVITKLVTKFIDLDAFTDTQLAQSLRESNMLQKASTSPNGDTEPRDPFNTPPDIFQQSASDNFFQDVKTNDHQNKEQTTRTNDGQGKNKTNKTGGRHTKGRHNKQKKGT